MTEHPFAIKLRHCFKSYNNGEVPVLQNFSMTLPKGSFYSLIGSSGCGKTTVLSCIVGTQHLNKGKITLFGSENISKQLWKVGYMPQEVSLYDRLSVLENLVFFGTLSSKQMANTSNEGLRKRAQFLIDLLGLPPFSRIVGTLSGGQRRRVSLSVSLMHDPELLLLDEPTCGVDPLMRERIWNYLKFLVKEKGTTIVITTHYIDEAKHSDIVGVMRDGQLIAEKEPSSLQENLGVSSLESAFTQLCKLQKCSHLPDIIEKQQMNYNATRRRSSVLSTELIENHIKNWNCLSMQRIHKLSGKHFKMLSRNISMLVFITVVPAVCILSICNTFSYEPHDIQIGIVDYELDDISECFQNSTLCNSDRLSCYFINELPANVMALKPFKSISDARNAVKAGTVWGYIYFSNNFSTAVLNILLTDGSTEGLSKQEEDVLWNNTKISASLDQTNTIIYASILNTLYKTFEKGIKAALKACDLNERRGELPLQYRTPIVGSDDVRALHYIAPGLSVCILYFFPATVALRFINEKRQGTLDRCLAGGASVLEILLSYAVTEFSVLIVQSSLVYLIMRYGYSIGDSLPIFDLQVFTILALCILQGLGGLAYGFILGVVFPEEQHAAMVIIATVLPYGFMSGLVWPVEGMPHILQKVCLVFPLTLPGEALRSMMIRGWDITYPEIWLGFLVTVAYMLVFLCITIMMCTKTRK